jgi:hypothetical protein
MFFEKMKIFNVHKRLKLIDKDRRNLLWIVDSFQVFFFLNIDNFSSTSSYL